jgi:hypothetical protein
VGALEGKVVAPGAGVAGPDGPVPMVARCTLTAPEDL